MLSLSSVLLLALWTSRLTGFEVGVINNIGQPKNCDDLFTQGNKIEGHYVVYPDASASQNVSMIYCSQEDGMEPMLETSEPAKNCLELLENGMTSSGPNVIFPYTDDPSIPVLVLCDQETDGGGWTVIQKRYDGSVDFYRPWVEYARSFGDVNHEHYLGNNNIAALTAQKVNELRVDLEQFDGTTGFAHYQMFHVDATATHEYRMQAAIFDGTAGDSLGDYHVGQPFSTFDVYHSDHNYNCPEAKHGAWWFPINACHAYAGSSLNGQYYNGADNAGVIDRITWYTFAGEDSLKATTMMIRPYSCASTLIKMGMSTTKVI